MLFLEFVIASKSPLIGIFFLPGAGGHNDKLLAFRGLEEIVTRKQADAFPGLEIAASKKAREAAVGGAIARKGKDVRCAVTEDETRADCELKSPCGGLILTRIKMGADDSGERIAVGNAKARKTEIERLRDAFLRMRGTTQERKIRRDGEFRERGARAVHAKSPCMNQRGAALSVS